MAVKHTFFGWMYLIALFILIIGLGLCITQPLIPTDTRIAGGIMCVIGLIFNHYLYKKRLKEWQKKQKPEEEEELPDEMFGIKLTKVKNQFSAIDGDGR